MMTTTTTMMMMTTTMTTIALVMMITVTITIGHRGVRLGLLELTTARKCENAKSVKHQGGIN
eukprot:255431-Pyramimonas_sp.AAC.1